MKEPLLLINKYGILTFTQSGKTLFLFMCEILGIVFLALVIRNWNEFSKESYGLAINIISLITITMLFCSIYFRRFLKIYFSEYIKQTAILLFIINIFLTLYYYHQREFQELYFYLNPITMLYIFILVYFITFYLIQNMV